MRYKIVTAGNAYELEDKVDKLLKSSPNWYITGGLVVVSQQSYGATIWGQALVWKSKE